MKVVTIIGARPQFIKAAVVSRSLKLNRTDLTEVLVHTGQHYDPNMSDVFFDELNIPQPLYNLGVGGGSHGQNTGQMIERIEEVLLTERPDWVLIYGDTDSTLASAIAAAKLHIPVAHVEAGLRSFDRRMPEEINRVLADHVSSLLFAPTETAVLNLIREGVQKEIIHNVGDVMYDAAIYYKHLALSKSRIIETLGLTPKQFVLLTVHRQENTDNKDKLESILEGIGTTQQRVIWPIHPRTKNRLREFSISVPSSITIIEPVGYLDMVMLEANAAVIATDSGGVQKEAYFQEVPCLIFRDRTEWVELSQGSSYLVGHAPEAIRLSVEKALKDFVHIPAGSFGAGNAGELISELLR